MSLSDSAKRSVRTGYHAFIAVVTAAPTVIPLVVSATKGTPYAERVAALGAVAIGWIAGVAVLVNKLEDAGVLPALLRTAGGEPTDVAPAPDPAP